MSRPSCCAGPVSAPDCPRRIVESVTPCADAAPAAARASAARSLRVMVSPHICFGHHTSGGGIFRDAQLLWPASTGEELPHLLHEALGARVVAGWVLCGGFFGRGGEGLLSGGVPHPRPPPHPAPPAARAGRANAPGAPAAPAEH